MTMHNQRINEFVTPTGRNFASGNIMKVTMKSTKRQLDEENTPTTLELLRMEGKSSSIKDPVKLSRTDKSVYARKSGDQAI